MTDPIEQTDAVVIGAGVVGCAIAWRRGQAGMRVVVVERGRVGGEASHAAAGMLAPLAEAEGEDEFFNLTVASLTAYADFARELKALSGVDVEYRDEGTLYPALTDEDEGELERRWRRLREAGLNVKRLNAGCALNLEPLLNQTLRFALKFPGDRQVDNRRLMTALHGAARTAGVEFMTHTEARELLTENVAGRRRVGGVATARGEIRSNTVVIAAGSWSSLLRCDEAQRFEVEPVRGQMAAIEMPTPAARHVIYSRRGYLVPRLSGYLIAGSTTERAGYDKRVTAGGIGSIIKSAIEIMPCVAGQAVIETWAGLRPRAPDDMPVLGADPRVEGLIYATGHYRNGILLAPITARAIGELIVKGESSVNLAPFSVARFSDRQAVG
ncbi:MAG TPA: glycine oxidase ThiO [Blastocatellia bacterium]|nr:glycine oxidase ThiO [Blastocatellia bacterium]